MRLLVVGSLGIVLLASRAATGQQAETQQVWGTGVIVKTIPASSFVPVDAFTAANMGVSVSGAGTTGSVAFRAVRIRYQLQLSEPPGSSSFDDVEQDDPARPAIEAMVAAGVATGCGNESFCPDNPVTRAQLAVYLARALGLHWGD